VPDLLEYLWPLAEATNPVVAAHVTSSWPSGVHARLRELGHLVPAAEADRVLCPECHDHFEEVLACEGPGRTTYFFISCPQHHRVRVSHDVRRQWTINLNVLAQTLATTLKVTGAVAEQSPGRVWRLGRTNLKSEQRDVLFARGLNWDDAETIRGGITSARKPIVFVPQAKPEQDFWTGRVPPIIALDQVAMLGESGIEIDPLEITAAIQDADAKASGAKAVVLTSEQLTLMIRRQIKAEQSTELNDDVFLAAYRQHGSVRKAAEFLSSETGKAISKDQVQRAVARGGGAAEVLNAEDSDSVVRPVASQSRDKKGKKLIRSKSQQE